MLRTVAMAIISTLSVLNAVSAAAPTAPYALSLLEEYAEYGSNPPPDICERENRNPCVMRRTVMYSPLANIESVRSKLNDAAWAALERATSEGQEIWVFNVCMDKWSVHPNCFSVFGVTVLNKQRVVFYSFFKPKTYPNSAD